MDKIESNCIYEDLVWGDSSKYTCIITCQAITRPSVKLVKVYGEHQAGKDNNDVKAAKFQRTFIEHLPRDLHILFPSLEIIQVQRCGLSFITRRDLIGLENILELQLSENEIRSLPDNLLTNMRSLKRISLADNKLQFLSSQLLEPIKDNGLTLVDFSNNQSIDAVYDPSKPSSASSIQQLMAIIDSKCQQPSGNTDLYSREKHELTDGHKETFLKGFKKLWASGKLSDFLIVVGSREFRVHKNVLSIISPVFAAMFENDMTEEQTSQMTIPDFSAVAVEEFLKYVYTGHIPNDTNAMELFALSAKYDVKGLKDACEEMIFENCDCTNALEIFALGHLYCSDDMKALAAYEIERSFPSKISLKDLMAHPEILSKIF